MAPSVITHCVTSLRTQPEDVRQRKHADIKDDRSEEKKTRVADEENVKGQKRLRAIAVRQGA